MNEDEEIVLRWRHKGVGGETQGWCVGGGGGGSFLSSSRELSTKTILVSSDRKEITGWLSFIARLHDLTKIKNTYIRDRPNVRPKNKGVIFWALNDWDQIYEFRNAIK